MAKKPTELPFEFGAPPMPKGMPRAQRDAWHKVTDELLAARKLAQSDTGILLELLQARAEQYKGAGAKRVAAKKTVARLEAIWTTRPAFPELQECPAPTKQGPTLEAFIVGVKNERDSFASRMLPNTTVTLDEGGRAYSWDSGDAAQIARSYAMQVTQGSIIAGELVRCACSRFLKELEMGHERGLFFDVVAARNIKVWFDTFGAHPIQDWQLFCVVNLMAWKRPSGLRRFSRFYLGVGRQNGKSTLLAALCLFGLVADQVDRAQVYSAATKKDQAAIVFRDAEHQVKKNSELSAYVKQQRYVLSVESTGSSFQYLGSDSNTLDGLRPSCCSVDEVHAHPNDLVTKRLQSGTISRSQPIILFATTAGEDRDSWAYSQHEIFERILRGTTEEFAFSDSWFIYIAQMDKDDLPEDETKWIKSNPSIGVTVPIEMLRTEAAALKSDPASFFSFVRFHCNIWQSLVASHSLPQDAINACVGCEMPTGGPTVLREKFLKKAQEDRTVFFGGIDAGLSDDFFAFVLVTPQFPAGLTHTGACNYKTAIVPWFFIPERRIKEQEVNLRIPLSQWIREGVVQVCGEDLVDFDKVEKVIRKLCETYRVPIIGYDAWKTEVMCARMHADRVSQFVKVPQMPSFLTAPSREFKLGVLNGTIAHLGNSCLKWMMSNVALEPDETHGGIKPAKAGGDRRLKIDGVQASVTAMQQMLLQENKKFFSGSTPKIYFI